jgi:signal peptidase I
LGEEYENQVPESFGDSQETQVLPPHPDSRKLRRKKKRSGTSMVLESIAIIIGAILIAVLMQSFIVKPFQIPSESMQPTIEPGDRILVNRLAYRFGDVEQGDIIVFESPQDPETDFVKRVIAVGGDTIEIDNHMVIVNGEALSEDYIGPWLNPNEPIFAQRTVPDGFVFVMGDNRDNSDDGRRWADPFLNEEKIVGKAGAVYWPLSRLQRL